MMTLIVFVEELQKTKCKASNQRNKENEYTGKSNGSLFDLALHNKPLPKPPVPQMQPRGLNGTKKGITFVVC